MQSIEVGFLKMEKSVYVGWLIREMSKRIRVILFSNLAVRVNFRWISLNCMNILSMLEVIDICGVI
jgi:hypothetical protein